MMEAIHFYEGTVNQVMGDGIMALFGAPIAHEDHAVRACYAALRIQESVRKLASHTEGPALQIRIGLEWLSPTACLPISLSSEIGPICSRPRAITKLRLCWVSGSGFGLSSHAATWGVGRLYGRTDAATLAVETLRVAEAMASEMGMSF
jgi:hypothetical protein